MEQPGNSGFLCAASVTGQQNQTPSAKREPSEIGDDGTLASSKRMKFGIALDYLDAEKDPRENFQILLKLVGAVRDAGFDLIYMGQHFMDDHYTRFQPLPMVSRLAAESGDMVVVFGDLLPLNNPVRVAESLATLDVLTDGRGVLLAVLGYRPIEFDTFHVSLRERSRRYKESFEIICRLTQGEEIEFEGRHYSMSGVKLGALRSVSKPRPAIWSTAHGDAGIKRSAEFGDVWFISHQPAYPELVDQIPRYQSYLEDAPNTSWSEFESHGISLPLLRETFVAESEKTAIETAADPMMASVASYVETGQLDALNDPDSYQAPFDIWRKNRALVGDPQQVAEDLERYRALGVDCAVLKLFRKGIPLESVLASIRLVGDEIIPQFS